MRPIAVFRTNEQLVAEGRQPTRMHKGSNKTGISKAALGLIVPR